MGRQHSTDNGALMIRGCAPFRLEEALASWRKDHNKSQSKPLGKPGESQWDLGPRFQGSGGPEIVSRLRTEGGVKLRFSMLLFRTKMQYGQELQVETFLTGGTQSLMQSPADWVASINASFPAHSHWWCDQLRISMEESHNLAFHMNPMRWSADT